VARATFFRFSIRMMMCTFLFEFELMWQHHDPLGRLRPFATKTALRPPRIALL
jgi:hypothetical protein